MKKTTLLIILLFFVQLIYAQWQQTSGPMCNFIYSIKSLDKYLFASSQQGVFRSSDGGSNWLPVNKGLKDTVVFTLETMGNMLIAGTQKNGVFSSSDYGNSWSEANNGLTAKKTVWTLLEENGFIYAGLNFGLFVTNDNGVVWSSLGTPISDVGSIIKTDSFIIVGGYTVLLSEDNGATWSIKNNGLPKDDITDLALCDSHLFCLTTNCGLYVSSDFGESWESITTFKIKSNNKIYVNDSYIFVGTSYYGVYFSSNQGATWKKISEGLPHGEGVYSLILKDGYVYAGTSHQGVWKRKLSDFVGVEKHEDANRISVWPNPACKKIQINSQHSLLQKVQVINLSGDVFENIYCNSNAVEVDLGNIPSGIYFLKVATNNGVTIEKLVKQ